MTLEEIKEKLEKYSKSNLLAFYNELAPKEQQALLDQIANIDLELVERIYNNRNSVANSEDETIEFMPYVDRQKLSSDQIDYYIKIGEDIIKEGGLAFAMLAGGQGTRLGHNGPKGTFKLNLNPDKSLFEIKCDNLKETYEKYNVYIPWYIMTSRDNNDSTIKFFEDNNYFGYPKDKVMFFKQGELPMVSEEGKILLESKSKIVEAADGHGGIFEAMNKNGVIEHMMSQNIKWIFIGGIDNVLLNMVDPLFIGMAESRKVNVASKSTVKAEPKEKVGAFCKRNGKPSVIEYSEITDEMAYLKDENGELVYGEAHILCNLFSIDALNLLRTEKLPYHVAHKKCSYVDENGNICTPNEPNAYKFETFIFDAFSKFDDMLILRCIREDEFAPIKNKEGVDSPETARDLYLKYWEKQLNITYTNKTD